MATTSEESQARSKASRGTPSSAVGRGSDVDLTEPGPSLGARLLSGAVRVTVHTAVDIVSHALQLPWPFGAIERAACALPAPRDLARTAVALVTDGEKPAALALMSPLLQLRPERPRVNGAMLPHRAFPALTALIAAHDGSLYEPLDHIRPGLPPTLIHVSGAEELAYDARLAVEKLAAAGVPTQLRVWPGQIHVFQLATPLIPEASRSLRQIGDYIRAAVSQDERSNPAA